MREGLRRTDMGGVGFRRVSAHSSGKSRLRAQNTAVLSCSSAAPRT